jgi:hypothetical protein
MMNEELEQFENRLRRQTLRPIPGDWRAEILARARDAQFSHHSSPATRRWLSTFNFQLSTFFWPNQKAWGALAVIWIFIFILNFSIRDKTPRVAEKTALPSPEVIAELKQQKLMFAELMGANDLRDADRQKSFLPRPRTQAPFEMLTA